MLIYFGVQGFKNFKTPISLELTAGDYKFNEKCIRNGVVHNVIIYGKNSVGKTNFGLALFDIVAHLTSNNVTPGLYDNYLACSNCRGEASFKYVFQFDEDKVVYEYRKEELRTLTYEKILLNGKIFMIKDYLNP